MATATSTAKSKAPPRPLRVHPSEEGNTSTSTHRRLAFDLIPLPGGVARSAGVVPLTLILIENAGLGPAFIYGRRSLPSKNEFDLNLLIFLSLNL
jgi:hypothetical protein